MFLKVSKFPTIRCDKPGQSGLNTSLVILDGLIQFLSLSPPLSLPHSIPPCSLPPPQSDVTNLDSPVWMLL